MQIDVWQPHDCVCQTEPTYPTNDQNAATVVFGPKR